MGGAPPATAGCDRLHHRESSRLYRKGLEVFMYRPDYDEPYVEASCNKSRRMADRILAIPGVKRVVLFGSGALPDDAWDLPECQFTWAGTAWVEDDTGFKINDF